MWSANQYSPQSRRESETASERAKISTPIICFPPSFIFSKREAPTTVNSARSHSGPEMEFDKSRYFGTCFRWETIGKIVPPLPRLGCLPLTQTMETFQQNNPPGGAWSSTAAVTAWNWKGTRAPSQEREEMSVNTYLPAPLSSGKGSRCGPQQPPGVNWEHWLYWSSGSSACPL